MYILEVSGIISLLGIWVLLFLRGLRFEELYSLSEWLSDTSCNSPLVVDFAI